MNSWPQTTRDALLVSLDPGDDLLEALAAACASHGLRDGVVVSGIGTLDRARLHCVTSIGYPPVEEYPEWLDEPLELVQVSGAIVSGHAHLHGTIATTAGAWGGHIEPGCRVLYLAEIVVLGLSAPSLVRAPDAHGVSRLRAADGDNPHVTAAPSGAPAGVHSKESP
jgi:uncharacterized protein